MTPDPDHLIVAPILIPLVAGAVMLLYGERRQRVKLAIALTSGVLMLGVALLLVLRAGSDEGAAPVYLLGDWRPPFGIVLVLDRLSAMMLLGMALLALPAMIYAAAGWQRRGQHFHTLCQFLLMGVNGAVLTGDLFNLYVFFEVMLAASYGLLLHGSGRRRVSAGLHYIAVNLTASALFLLGVAIIYGTAGTLNMADLAQRVPRLAAADRPLVHAGAAILGVAFLVKAGVWPLCFWLPRSYAAAAAPVAALFAIMTKVGVYIVIRLGLLVFGAGAGVSAGFGSEVLIAAGMATMVFGTAGMLAAQDLARMSGYLILVSSATVLTVAGFAMGAGDAAMLAGGLYYMLASLLATSALYLMSEPMTRDEGAIAGLLALTADAFGADAEDEDEQDPDPGPVLPGALTLLGICFAACVLLLAGLPPLAGFVGKFAMMAAAMSGAAAGAVAPLQWVFVALLLLSGLATLIALTRIGVQLFWAAEDDIPQIRALEVAPVALLVAASVLMTVKAEPVMRYTNRTAAALVQGGSYIDAVMTTPPVADRAARP